MCEPTTLAVMSMTLTAAATGTKIYAAKKQQDAANAAAEYNAKQYEYNAELSELKAQQAEVIGQEEEQVLRKRMSILEGKQRAAQAGSGVVVDTGSALTAIQSTAALGEIDAMTIRRNAKQQATAFRIEGASNIAQSQLERSKIRGSGLEQFTTALTGASQLGSQYGIAKKKKIF